MASLAFENLEIRLHEEFAKMFYFNLFLKSLAKAAEVIRLGAERMMQGNSDEYNGCIAMQAQPAKQDYFSELMKLRQRWKVKKTGGTMTGDLSYRSGRKMLD